MELVSTGTVNTFRGKTATGADNDRVQLIIDSVSEKFRGYVDNVFQSTAVLNESHPTVIGSFIVLDNSPVISVEQIRTTTEVIASGTYTVNANGLIQNVSGTLTGQELYVDYTYGYSTIPSDIQTAAIVQVLYELEYTGRESRIGDKRTVLENGGTSTFITDEFHPTVKTTLDRYRRVS